MRLGYNTNGLRDHRLDEGLELLAAHGYRAVALTLDVGALDPATATAAEVAAVARRLAALDLQPVVETGGRFVLDPRRKHEPTLMTRDAAARDRRIGFYARCAAIGRDLGARVLAFWTGVDRGDDRAARRDAEAWLDDGVARTAELVRAAGLQPALEPEPGMAVATVAAYRDLVARLGAGVAPALCLDVGHLYVEDEGDPLALIAACGPELVQVHLEDMRRGIHEHLVPGEGEVDFAGVYRALVAAGYGGPVCFELSRSSHRAPEAVAVCAALWRRLTSGREPDVNAARR